MCTQQIVLADRPPRIVRGEVLYRSADCEPADPVRLFVVDVQRFDSRPRRADSAVVDDTRDRVGFTLQHDLDRPVRPVARPTRDAAQPRLIPHRGAKPDALHVAVNDHAAADEITGHAGILAVCGSVRGARQARSLMNAIWLLIGLVVGAAAVWLVMRSRIEHERALAQERLDSQDQLSASFKALSAEALQGSMAQLTELARGQLQATQAEAKGDLDQRRHAVEQLVAPLREQLGRVDAQLESLDRERRESRGRLEAQLRTLTDTGEKLRTETGALVTALRKPNTRGQWGQMQLRNVVELSGMLSHCDFVEQPPIGGIDGPLRPDLIVTIPGGKHVIVDAKAPLQGVLDAYEARDDAERDRFLQDHAKLLRKHVRALADKEYWAGLDSTPDLVVMFLPGEHLYGAALEADPTLIEDAMARRVLIATPTTLLAMLRAIAYGWQQERVAESAQAVSELGRELHGRLVKLSELFATLGKRLNSTVGAYNEAVGSYEARVLPSARRFVDHGAATAGRELNSLEQVTLSARSLRAAELIEEEAPEPAPRRLFAAD
jgi:DNA recombination protein RmuC